MVLEACNPSHAEVIEIYYWLYCTPPWAELRQSFCWVPSHIGVASNDFVYAITKRGSHLCLCAQACACFIAQKQIPYSGFYIYIIIQNYWIDK